MNLLVTAGNTLALIDRVRCITNIFTGRTGARIALEAHSRGHAVTLLTSHPDAMGQGSPTGLWWNLLPYKTFEDLRDRMADLIPSAQFDAIVHCAAVSDYLSAGVYGLDGATRFDAESATWSGLPKMIDRAAGKIKSDEPELWVRLVRAPKLVDRIRTDWKFRGMLVKFKLEVGVSDIQLLAAAERSRVHSSADLMVANTLEGAADYAFVGASTNYEHVTREELPGRLLDIIERRVAR
jgi:phosphopantothenate---cysteine ligase (CTP)